MRTGGLKALLGKRPVQIGIGALLVVIAGLLAWHLFSPKAVAERKAEKTCADAGKPYEDEQMAEQCRLAEKAGISCASIKHSQAAKDIHAQAELLRRRCVDSVTQQYMDAKR